MTFGKYELLAAVSAIAVASAGPAFAGNMKMFSASPTADSGNANVEMAASETGAFMQSTNQIRAEKLVGKKLTNAQGNAIGDAESVIIDKDGKVAALIVGVGGYLGVGEHRVAIAWKDLQVLNGGRTIRTNLSKAELKGLPEYSYKQTAKRGKWSKNPHYPNESNDRNLKAGETM